MNRMHRITGSLKNIGPLSSVVDVYTIFFKYAVYILYIE